MPIKRVYNNALPNQVGGVVSCWLWVVACLGDHMDLPKARYHGG